MKFKTWVENCGKIKDIDKRNDLTLVTDSQDVEAIRDYLGHKNNIMDYEGFFVNIENGDYTEIYAFNGIVPELNKDLFKITWGMI